jgi:hypothetical protein
MIIKEYIDLIIAALVALAILMYDVLLDLVFNLLHFIFEVIHIMYEWCELGIEHAVEHLFHTSRHGSQVITFYILLLIACLLIYWLWKAMPRLYKLFKQYMRKTWECRKIECKAYWLSLTLSKKVRLLSSTAGIVYLTSFLIT